MKSKIPPQTKRYCTNCKKITSYKFDKMIHHSYCIECGASSMFAKRHEPKYQKEGKYD